jgi:hypothetical protein
MMTSKHTSGALMSRPRDFCSQEQYGSEREDNMAANRTADAVSAQPHCFREKFRCIPHSFKMGLSQFVQVSLVACAICASSTVQAASYFQSINAASCSFNRTLTNPPLIFVLDHTLNGQGQTALAGAAYCQLTMSSDWPVENLVSVEIFGATNAGQSIRVSLCVNSGFTAQNICGDESTISIQSGQAAVVYPPQTLPVGTTGAFVKIIFPQSGGTARVFQLVPSWQK